MDGTTKGVALMVLSATSFGTLGIFGKLASAAGLSIPTVLAFRFIGGSLLFWALLAALGRKAFLRGRSLGYAILLGAGCYAVQSGLYFWGLEYMAAGLVGIVVYTYPVFVILISRVVLDERITRYTVVALLLVFGGVVLISGVDPAGADIRGIVIVLGAALVYAVYYVTSHVALGDVDPQTLTAHVLPAAVVSFVAFGAATGDLTLPTTGYEWSVLFGLALFGTAIPIGAFFAGLAYIGASRASIISSLEPITAVALGVIFLGEPLEVATVAGGLAVLCGIVLVEREER